MIFHSIFLNALLKKINASSQINIQIIEDEAFKYIDNLLKYMNMRHRKKNTFFFKDCIKS